VRLVGCLNRKQHKTRSKKITLKIVTVQITTLYQRGW